MRCKSRRGTAGAPLEGEGEVGHDVLALQAATSPTPHGNLIIGALRSGVLLTWQIPAALCGELHSPQPIPHYGGGPASPGYPHWPLKLGSLQGAAFLETAPRLLLAGSHGWILLEASSWAFENIWAVVGQERLPSSATPGTVVGACPCAAPPWLGGLLMPECNVNSLELGSPGANGLGPGHAVASMLLLVWDVSGAAEVMRLPKAANVNPPPPGSISAGATCPEKVQGAPQRPIFVRLGSHGVARLSPAGPRGADPELTLFQTFPSAPKTGVHMAGMSLFPALGLHPGPAWPCWAAQGQCQLSWVWHMGCSPECVSEIGYDNVPGISGTVTMSILAGGNELAPTLLVQASTSPLRGCLSKLACPIRAFLHLLVAPSDRPVCWAYDGRHGW